MYLQVPIKYQISSFPTSVNFRGGHAPLCFLTSFFIYTSWYPQRTLVKCIPPSFLYGELKFYFLCWFSCQCFVHNHQGIGDDTAQDTRTIFLISRGTCKTSATHGMLINTSYQTFLPVKVIWFCICLIFAHFKHNNYNDIEIRKKQFTNENCNKNDNNCDCLLLCSKDRPSLMQKGSLVNTKQMT